MLFQQILNGLTNGSLYALMAVGVTMVYKSLGMLNFAHGDIMMVGTFITLTFITKLGLPFYVSVPLGIICAAGLGFLLERVILRKVKFSSFVNLLIATVGVSYVLRNASMVIWGTNPAAVPQHVSLGTDRNWRVPHYPAVYRHYHHLSWLSSPACISSLPKSRSASACSLPTLTLRRCHDGVNVTYMRFLTFGISAALACIAGVMIAPADLRPC